MTVRLFNIQLICKDDYHYLLSSLNSSKIDYFQGNNNHKKTCMTIITKLSAWFHQCVDDSFGRINNFIE